MLENLISPPWVVLYLFVGAAAYVHFRGRERHALARQLTDHSTIMAPYNAVMYLFSAVPNDPVIDVGHFPQLARLRDNWQTIREEALRLYEAGHVRAADSYNDLGFNSFFRRGWKRFYLKWYDDFLPSARELCPKTVELLDETAGINAAMFAVMAPRSQLVRHRDPFAGSLRYHLGLITPNSDDCRIYIDGTPYAWRDGADILFDETYIHRAVNDTDAYRVILFCDVERPLRSIAWLNRFVSRNFVKAAATRNVPGEKVGVLNRLFEYAYRVRLVGKRLKAWNATTYYALKYLLLAGLFYLIFF